MTHHLRFSWPSLILNSGWLSTRGHITRGQEDEPASVDRTAIATYGLPSRPIGGLGSQEAAARRITFGPNEPAATRQYSGLRDYVRTLASPLVLILLCASAISMFVGEVLDA